MSWLDRLFGHHENSEAEHKATNAAPNPSTKEPLQPERTGLNGEFDQSGLAKRVAKAFDDAGLADSEHLWIAQTGTTVVLKGTVVDHAMLSQMVQIARGVSGAQAIETDQVKVSKQP